MTKAERFDAASGSSTRSSDSLVECLVVLKHRQIADTLLANQQDEGVCLRDFLGERFRPESSSRKLDGARNTLESVSLRSSAALSLSPRARSGEW
jgi:hypothetical protein